MESRKTLKRLFVHVKKMNIIPHLFRTEYSKIVAVLCKTYGFSNIELAEDIVSDTFLKATETWGLKGVPEHPTAWLYHVAKNRVKDHFKREQVFNEKVKPSVKGNGQEAYVLDFSEENIEDSMLRMMFAVCHPLITTESQIALALRVLCGFSIDEIANALLSNKANINKRLIRAKEKLRNNNFDINTFSKDELKTKINGVLSILYLLFNEGYFSTVSNKKVRKDLCFEAMRLLYIMLHNSSTNQPSVAALMALFCFQASRFEARTNELGEQVLYENQNTEQWDDELIKKGEYYLGLSAPKKRASKYHLEAMISFWHTRKNPDQTRKWESILQLYNKLLQLQYSPIAALNRTFALAMVHGKEVALQEALKIKLHKNPLYHSLLAELYHPKYIEKQVEHLQEAIRLTKNKSDIALLEKKLGEIFKK